MIESDEQGLKSYIDSAKEREKMERRVEYLENLLFLKLDEIRRLEKGPWDQKAVFGRGLFGLLSRSFATLGSPRFSSFRFWAFLIFWGVLLAGLWLSSLRLGVSSLPSFSGMFSH